MVEWPAQVPVPYMKGVEKPPPPARVEQPAYLHKQFGSITPGNVVKVAGDDNGPLTRFGLSRYRKQLRVPLSRPRILPGNRRLWMQTIKKKQITGGKLHACMN